MVALFRCEVGTWPSTYLRLPLNNKPFSYTFWEPIVEKIERCLSSWKGTYISKGDQLTLIQATPSNLPTYFLSLFKISSKAVDRIEKLCRIIEWSELSTLLLPPNSPTMDDTWRWILDKSSQFTSKSLAHHLASCGIEQKSTLYKNIWRGLIPRNIRFFLWKVNDGSINTVDVLIKKAPWIVSAPNWRVLCHHALIGLLWFHTIILGENFIMLQPSSGLPKWPLHSIEFVSHWPSIQEWESAFGDHHQSLLLAHIEWMESSYL